MNLTTRTRYRFVFIGLCVLLMAAAVYVIGQGVQEGQHKPVQSSPVAEAATSSQLVGEVSGFQRAGQALGYLAAPSNSGTSRSLDAFYARRAYLGAPPVIPHAIQDEGIVGGATCLTCHQNGGFVTKFNAYTPVVPHPEMLNCRQCHVTANASNTFQDVEWQRITPPPLNNAALPGSPPPIPHALQMRENCLACHAGPGAVPELRVTHPERINCRQCHVLTEEAGDWVR